jgi:hypothetical protein
MEQCVADQLYWIGDTPPQIGVKNGQSTNNVNYLFLLP